MSSVCAVRRPTFDIPAHSSLKSFPNSLSGMAANVNLLNQLEPVDAALAK